MFCKYCGTRATQLSDGSFFCEKCMKKLVLNESKQSHIPHKETFSDMPKSNEEVNPNNSRGKVGTSEKFKKQLSLKHTKRIFLKNLFIQVFNKHSIQERNDILKSGLELNEVNEIKLEDFQPWFYSRVFIILFVVFVIFEICLIGFNNSNLTPAVMLIGSVYLPFSLLTLYFELNVYKDISFFRTVGIFLLGGAVSLLFTLFLYEIIIPKNDYSLTNAALISIIEEIGKVFIIIILLKKQKNLTVLQGLLIGGAIGCGFTVFESAGYAFNVFLNAHDYNTRVGLANDILPWYYQKYAYTDSLGAMNFNIFLRSVLSFGGHTAWAAIEGAAFGKSKKVDIGFIKALLICFILHAVWDWSRSTESEIADFLKLIALCIIAWNVIIKQIVKFIVENQFIEKNHLSKFDIKETNCVEEKASPQAVISKSIKFCKYCGTELKKEAQFCSKCGKLQSIKE